MPDWKVHLLFGCILAVVWFNIFYFGRFIVDPFKTAFLLLLSLFSTVFADIDEKHSKIRSFISLGSAFSISAAYIIIYPATWYYALFYFVILFAIFRFVPTKHRGITHSVKFSLLFSVLLTMLFFFGFDLGPVDAILWFSIIFLSYGVHLLLDSL
jgi:membrane-bound metal-dependent hydrolase YbcI (DUF457 family)